MKKLLPALFLVLLYAAASAQTPAPAPSATPVPPQLKGNPHPDPGDHVFYCCRYCDYTASAIRSCPVHQVPLIKVGSWYCIADGKSFDKQGACPNDQRPLVKMELKYKTTTTKPDNMNKAEPKDH